MKKKEVFTVIGAIIGLVAIYKFTLILGIVALICGLVARHQKSTYWSWVVIGATAVISLHFLRMFY